MLTLAFSRKIRGVRHVCTRHVSLDFGCQLLLYFIYFSKVMGFRTLPCLYFGLLAAFGVCGCFWLTLFESVENEVNAVASSHFHANRFQDPLILFFPFFLSFFALYLFPYLFTYLFTFSFMHKARRHESVPHPSESKRSIRKKKKQIDINKPEYTRFYLVIFVPFLFFLLFSD